MARATGKSRGRAWPNREGLTDQLGAERTVDPVEARTSLRIPRGSLLLSKGKRIRDKGPDGLSAAWAAHLEAIVWLCSLAGWTVHLIGHAGARRCSRVR